MEIPVHTWQSSTVPFSLRFPRMALRRRWDLAVMCLISGQEGVFPGWYPSGSRGDRWGDPMPVPAQRDGPMGMSQASYGTAASSWTKSLLLKSFLQPMFIKCLPFDTGLHVGNASVGKNKMLPPALVLMREPNNKNKRTSSCEECMKKRNWV